MHYLVLETSSSRGMVALLENQQILFKKEVSLGVREANELMPLIQMGFNECGLSVDQIQSIVIGKGPGSFTGLRIGATVAKALAYAKNVAILSVDSLKIFHPHQEGPFLVILDAKAKGFFLQRGIVQEDEVIYEDKPYLVQQEELKIESLKYPLLVTTDKTPFLPILTRESLLNLKELNPDPITMLLMALKTPSQILLDAKDLLDLEYFNTP